MRRLTIVLLTLLIAGCGGTTTGPPPGSPAPAPPIPVPLDGARFIADPCSAITVEQVESIGFTGGVRDTGGEARCVLAFGPIVRVQASWLSPLRETLDTLYSDHASGKDTGNRWEELTIKSYPVVVVWAEENVTGRQDKGPLACRLALGLDEETLMYVGTNIDERAEAGPWQYDSCGAAKKVTEFVIDNLRV